ncbi:hypothetical protein KV557_24845 [Kitasatospora aureofaciens]|uniref:hypothetical protein n=1 Tax=Kitasatospora aureofaciens TaxID=1894 RepID=UPI001C441518|nr:hypothetical protein [Kitasatospora aureofaciens]MBV6700294.1 hypothetical protein [Kitasatospora aureofaciens]
MCPLAAREDLVRSVQLNPGIAREYADAEEQMGKPFKKTVTVAQLIEEAGI